MPTAQHVVQRMTQKKKLQWERKQANKVKDQKRKAERDLKTNERKF